MKTTPICDIHFARHRRGTKGDRVTTSRFHLQRFRAGTGINRGRDNGILNGGRIDTAAKCRVRERIEIRHRGRWWCRGVKNTYKGRIPDIPHNVKKSKTHTANNKMYI